VPSTRRRILVLIALTLASSVVLGIGGSGAPAAAAPPTETARASRTAAGGQEREITVRVFDRKGTRESEDDEPVEGAVITVVDAAGDEVDQVETDDEGEATITLPGEGQYVATLDLETLGDDVGLPREGGEQISIDPNRSRIVNFVLGDRQRSERTFTDKIMQTSIDGVRFGLVIAMASIGLSLIFGTTGLVNFAHGEVVTFGAIVTWFLVNDHGVNLILATVIAMGISAFAGGSLDRVLWRPLRSRGVSLIAMMVVSIGLSFLLRYFFQVWFGRDSTAYAQYSVGRTSTYELFGVTSSATQLATIVISLVVLITVGLLVLRTRMGKAMRAVADNPELAESSGIDVKRVVLYVWAVGSALAALGGVLHGLSEEVKFDFGNDLLLLMFAGVVLGGLGSAFGALVGGFAVGMLVQLSTLWLTPNLKTVGALAVLILILLVRPQGILGRAERVG
jgi:branched-chain amino acid transport system permease protein